MKRLWLMQAVVNAVLFWCVFAWLGIRDSRTSQLVETFGFGILIAVPWLWLQDGTLVFCSNPMQGVVPAFRRSVRTLGIFSAVVILFILLVWGLGKLEAPFAQAGQRTASWLTLHLRKPIKPVTWATAYVAILWGVRWIVLPVLILPVAAGAALNGRRGMWRTGRRVFWLEYLIALLLGFYVPSLLMHWVPKLTGTTAQVASFVLRFGVAYLLIITTWLALAFFSAAKDTVTALPTQSAGAASD